VLPTRSSPASSSCSCACLATIGASAVKCAVHLNAMASPARSRALMHQNSSHIAQYPSTGWPPFSNLDKPPCVYHCAWLRLHVGHFDRTGTRAGVIG